MDSASPGRAGWGIVSEYRLRSHDAALRMALGASTGRSLWISPLSVHTGTVSWNEFKHDEQVYDLKHLRGYTVSFERSAKGKRPAENFSVNVTFSHHCFTRGLPRDGSAYDLTLGFEHEGDRRIFDAGRWELSKLLPDIIAKLPTNRCQQSGYGNFFTIEMIARDGSKIEYEVFFRVWKPGRGRIFLHVESAYVREANYGSSRPKGVIIDFYVILHNTRNNRAIHV